MAEAVAKANYKWRVVDIVVAAILAVASGLGHRLHRSADFVRGRDPRF